MKKVSPFFSETITIIIKKFTHVVGTSFKKLDEFFTKFPSLSTYISQFWVRHCISDT